MKPEETGWTGSWGGSVQGRSKKKATGKAEPKREGFDSKNQNEKGVLKLCPEFVNRSYSRVKKSQREGGEEGLD